MAGVIGFGSRPPMLVTWTAGSGLWLVRLVGGPASLAGPGAVGSAGKDGDHAGRQQRRRTGHDSRRFR